MSNKLMVNGAEISVTTIDDKDYISLTDMLKAKDGDFFISDWLRNRNTVEFLGIWEQIHNPASNYGEFAIIRSRVVDLLPNPEELNCIPVTKPIRDEEIAILRFQHVGQGNIILIVNRGHGDLRAIDHEFVAHWSTSLTSCMKASSFFPMGKTKKHIVQRNCK